MVAQERKERRSPHGHERIAIEVEEKGGSALTTRPREMAIQETKGGGKDEELQQLQMLWRGCSNPGGGPFSDVNQNSAGLVTKTGIEANK